MNLIIRVLIWEARPLIRPCRCAILVPMTFEVGLVLVAILVLSAVVHEVAHGFAADTLGDPTARLQGRLTFNPIVHIDLFGSVILPGLLIFTGSPIMFGYAKPVPYNPYNLKGRFAEGFVAAAGALSNFALAIIVGLVLRFGGFDLTDAFSQVLSLAVYINLMLGIFNLIPIPPLDGSKVLGSLLPFSLQAAYRRYEERLSGMGGFSGFLLVLLIFWAFSPVFAAVLRGLYFLIVGAPFVL
jgi:Zn-dependent protease